MERIIKSLVFFFSAVALLACMLSILFYPGGGNFNYQFEGYSFTENIFNDLTRVKTYVGSFNSSRDYVYYSCISFSMVFISLVISNFQRYARERSRIWYVMSAIMTISLFVHAIGMCYFPLDLNEPKHMLFYHRFLFSGAFIFLFLGVAEYFEPLYSGQKTWILLSIGIVNLSFAMLAIWGPLPWIDKGFLQFYAIFQAIFFVNMWVGAFLFMK